MVGGHGGRRGPVAGRTRGCLCEQKQRAPPRALSLQSVSPSPRPEVESSHMLSQGLNSATKSPGEARAGTSGSPRGNQPPSTWLGAGRGMGTADEWEALSPGTTKRGGCWYSRTPTFTAEFPQRHQTLGHSSRAQPASLVASPSPQPWTVPRYLWRGCSAEGGSEIHDRRSPSPSEECHL